MNYYSIAKFLHIVGALGFFVALALEWMSLRQLRRAVTVEQVREWMGISTGVGRMGIASMVLILISGFYMMAIARIGTAWIIVAFWTFVLLAVIAVALTRPRMAAIRRLVTAGHEPVSPDLHHSLYHPLLRISIQTRVAIALGIVFLMTVKPDLSGSLLTVGIAAVLGLASALPTPGRERAQEELGE